MNDIDLETFPEPYRDLLRDAAVAPSESVIKENGRPLARVVPTATGTRGTSDDWTDAKNNRRCDLIDREIDGTMTPEERVELEDLQDQMLRHRHRVAPLPLAHAQRLLDELERKAAAAGGSRP